MIRLRTILAAIAAATLAAAEPADLAELVMPAGAPATVRLRAAPGEELAWRVSGWDGAVHAAGTATADPAGLAAVDLRLPAGWHQLSAGGSHIGLIVRGAPRPQRPSDPFFAIDAALLEVPGDAGRRRAMVGQLRALGLAAVRERIKWNGLQPAPGPLADSRHRDGELDRIYTAAGLEVLHVFHDTPAWVGRLGGVLPADLADTADSWQAIAARFASPGHAIEVWNEPDSPDYIGDATPDQLAALARAVAWSARQGDPQVRIVAGVFADQAVTPAYRAMCWDNGLQRTADVVSWHDYGDPLHCQERVAALRRELSAAGAPGIALWLTESGLGDGDDARNALAIAMRAVEARACGVARHYAFVYPAYTEGVRTYGMTAVNGSPLRSLAAYAHLAERLGGLAYAGDLAVPGARRARLFAGAGRAVAVVWLGDPGGAALRTRLPVLGCHGLDGREMSQRVDGSWAVPDGACILDLDPAVVAQADAATPAMELLLQAAVPRARPEPSPLVVQLIPSAGGASPCGDRHVVAVEGGRSLLTIRVGNMAAGLVRVRLALVPPPGGAVDGPAEREVVIAGPGWLDTPWPVRLGSAGSWRIVSAGPGGWSDSLVVRLQPEVDGAALLASTPAAYRRELTQAELLAWDRNAIAGTGLDFAPADGGVRIAAGFPPARPPVHRRWACPRLTLPADARLGPGDAMLLRLRVRERTGVYAYLFEPGGNVGWSGAAAIVPADGAWHWALVRPSDLTVNHTDRDPSGRLEAESADRLGIGFGIRRGDANTVDVGTAVVLRGGR